MTENDWFFDTFTPDFDYVIMVRNSHKHKYFWRVAGATPKAQLWMVKNITKPTSGFSKYRFLARLRAKRATKRVNKRWHKR